MKLSPQRLAERRANFEKSFEKTNGTRVASIKIKRLMKKQCRTIELLTQTDRQRQMRDENKRPTLAQATKVLKRLERKFVGKQQEAVERRKGKEASDQNAKYGTLGESFVRDVGERLKLANKRWKAKNWMTVSDWLAAVSVLLAVSILHWYSECVSFYYSRRNEHR